MIKNLIKGISLIITKNVVWILVLFLLFNILGYRYFGTVNHQICAIYGDQRELTDTIYLNDNGLHVDLVIKDTLGYTSYGWGSRHFFVDVPSWDDADYKDILHVLENEKDVVIRETSYKTKREDWNSVPLTKGQLDLLIHNISDSYYYDDVGEKVIVEDNINYNIYYKAMGKYKYNYTCNSWTNDMLKNSDMYARKNALFSSQVVNLYK